MDINFFVPPGYLQFLDLSYSSAILMDDTPLPTNLCNRNADILMQRKHKPALDRNVNVNRKSSSVTAVQSCCIDSHSIGNNRFIYTQANHHHVISRDTCNKRYTDDNSTIFDTHKNDSIDVSNVDIIQDIISKVEISGNECVTMGGSLSKHMVNNELVNHKKNSLINNEDMQSWSEDRMERSETNIDNHENKDFNRNNDMSDTLLHDCSSFEIQSTPVKEFQTLKTTHDNSRCMMRTVFVSSLEADIAEGDICRCKLESIICNGDCENDNNIITMSDHDDEDVFSSCLSINKSLYSPNTTQYKSLDNTVESESDNDDDIDKDLKFVSTDSLHIENYHDFINIVDDIMDETDCEPEWDAYDTVINDDDESREIECSVNSILSNTGPTRPYSFGYYSDSEINDDIPCVDNVLETEPKELSFNDHSAPNSEISDTESWTEFGSNVDSPMYIHAVKSSAIEKRKSSAIKTRLSSCSRHSSTSVDPDPATDTSLDRWSDAEEVFDNTFYHSFADGSIVNTDCELSCTEEDNDKGEDKSKMVHQPFARNAVIQVLTEKIDDEIALKYNQDGIESVFLEHYDDFVNIVMPHEKIVEEKEVWDDFVPGWQGNGLWLD
ncbi:unnamed protein product [Owenia fusiformis]|uniref:Uncharacterized protein n=1 Tax=Owenia fusiformis TaxID=6347 RepID=A0A8S4MUP9_OWEFU|nr:unnamed protein product [Owenia fusiformis]